MSATTVSPRGIAALALHEGIVPAPYLDSVGVWTFGIGHTAAAGPPVPSAMPRGMPTDLDGAISQAAAVFARDLQRYTADVARAVRVPLAQHELDALVSFHVNTGGIARAELTKHLNAGRRDAAARAFMGWLKPAEVRNRRIAEQRLFRDGVYPTGRIPVWSVNGAGRVVWRAVRHLSPEALMAAMEKTAPQART